MIFPKSLDECSNEVRKEIRDFQNKILEDVLKEGKYVWVLVKQSGKLDVLCTNNDEKESEKLALVKLKDLKVDNESIVIMSTFKNVHYWEQIFNDSNGGIFKIQAVKNIRKN